MLKILSTLLALFSLTILAEKELISPEEAFKPVITIKNNTVLVDFKIADDYYLYKDKINLITLDKSQLGNAVFSQSKIKNDDFFGVVDIYRNTAKISYPIISGGDYLNLELSYQGCADLGVCYPPINKIIKLKNPIKLKNSFLQSLKNQNSLSDPVNVDIAFALDVFKIDNNIKAVWKIRDNYYLYNDKFNFTIKGADFSEIQIPQGESKKDDYFGEVIIHKKQLEINIPLTNIKNKIDVTVSFQGCWDGGVCYPPVQKIITLDEVALKSTQQSVNTTKEEIKTKVTDKQNKKENIIQKKQKTLNNQQTTPKITTQPDKLTVNNNTNNPVELNEEQKVASIFTSNSALITLLTFFIFGLALSFTPCVFPMIPILSSLIIGQQNNSSKVNALLMSIVFVLFMALAYTIFGVLAGLFGSNIQIILQNPWVLGLFSLVFVALAFSMFGYFEIKLPNCLQNKLTLFSNKQKSGNLIGVAIMGFLSALIVGPCIAPPLAGSLIYIGQTGDATLGGAALFMMSIGMGIPLILIGAGISKAPKAGLWLNSVKYIFGVVMLGMAIYLLERIIPETITLILWASLFTIAPITLGVTTGIATSSPWQRIFKAIGIIILGYGILLWLLVAKGGGDMYQPLKGLNQNNNFIAQEKVSFTKIKSLTEFNKIISSTDKLVMLDFYADWCIYCKVYDKKVFTDPRVVKILKNTINIKADVTKNTEDNKALMKFFTITAPPAILFFKNGKELTHKRIIGEKNADEFFVILQGL